MNISLTVVDLIGQLLVIEKAEVVEWLEKEVQPEVSPRPMQGADGTTNMPRLQTVASGGWAPQLSIIQVIIAPCKLRTNARPLLSLRHSAMSA